MLIAVQDTATPQRQSEDSLAELARLATTAGAEPVGQLVQKLRAPHPTTYFQRGKLDELRQCCSDANASLVIADDELSPTQQRALEEATGCRVVDRTSVILDVFAQHAHTRDGSLQVELAQLRYTLPRLVSTEKAFSRLGAGIGTRGPGESKLETDRRRIKGRITRLLNETEALRGQRQVRRHWRGRQGVDTIALVGYTNSGKSTLMNSLTGAETRAEDQLFATLDPTTRHCVLPGKGRVLLTDTVGFIQKLPSDLVAAFKATLEEVADADLLLHVVDASHPHYLDQALVAYAELDRLGALDRPVITALNKADLRAEPIPESDLEAFPNPVVISATTGEGLWALRATMGRVLADAYHDLTVHIPYTHGALVHLFRERGTIQSEEFTGTGTRLSGRLPRTLVGVFDRFREVRPAS